VEGLSTGDGGVSGDQGDNTIAGVEGCGQAGERGHVA